MRFVFATLVLFASAALAQPGLFSKSAHVGMDSADSDRAPRSKDRFRELHWKYMEAKAPRPSTLQGWFSGSCYLREERQIEIPSLLATVAISRDLMPSPFTRPQWHPRSYAILVDFEERPASSSSSPTPAFELESENTLKLFGATAQPARLESGAWIAMDGLTTWSTRIWNSSLITAVDHYMDGRIDAYCEYKRKPHAGHRSEDP